MIKALLWLTVSIGFLANAIESPKGTAIWLVGKNSVALFLNETHYQVLTDIEPKSSLIDPVTCNLWVQSKTELLKLNTQLQVLKRIPSAERILGNTLLEDSFFTIQENQWTQRDREGNPIQNFKSPLSFPIDWVGNTQMGFWTLDFQESQKKLSLVHMNHSGQAIWDKTISEKRDLWGTPQLHWSSDHSWLWVGFTASSPEHAYSPQLDLWLDSGRRLKTLQFSERGLLLGSCLQKDGSIWVARDLPSSPYTAPLYTHLEKVGSDMDYQLLFRAPLNDLIPALQCRDQQVWLTHQSLFQSDPSWLGFFSHPSSEKKLLVLKEPAWKMHACSLE